MGWISHTPWKSMFLNHDQQGSAKRHQGHPGYHHEDARRNEWMWWSKGLDRWLESFEASSFKNIYPVFCWIKLPKLKVQLSLMPDSANGPKQHGRCSVITFLVKKVATNGTFISWVSTTILMGIGWMPTRIWSPGGPWVSGGTNLMKLVQQHEFLSHLPWNVLRWNA